MSLAKLVVHCDVITGCQLFTKEKLIEQMLLKMAIAGVVPVSDLPALTAAILRREGLGSTGIGQEIALPHTIHSSINQPMAAAFLFQPAVQFESIVAEPADIFVLFLSPPSRPGLSMRGPSTETMLLHRNLRRDDFRERFRRCKSGDEIRALLLSLENAG